VRNQCLFHYLLPYLSCCRFVFTHGKEGKRREKGDTRACRHRSPPPQSSVVPFFLEFFLLGFIFPPRFLSPISCSLAVDDGCTTCDVDRSGNPVVAMRIIAMRWRRERKEGREEWIARACHHARCCCPR
jgi:hypothetical protein